jgi:hypothetical protein
MKNIANIFNEYDTTEGIPFKLLSKNIHFPESNNEIYAYTYVSENIPWTVMSFNLYNTIDYWWVLSSLNKTQPFYAKRGNTIKYIPKSILEEILSYI